MTIGILNASPNNGSIQLNEQDVRYSYQGRVIRVLESPYLDRLEIAFVQASYPLCGETEHLTNGMKLQHQISVPPLFAFGFRSQSPMLNGLWMPFKQEECPVCTKMKKHPNKLQKSPRDIFMVHCRSPRHVAHKFQVKVKDLEALIKLGRFPTDAMELAQFIFDHPKLL